MQNLFFSMIKLTTALDRMTLRKLGRSSIHYWGRITNRIILSELLVNDIFVSDPKSMTDSLNDYFVNIGLTLAAEYEEESCNIAQIMRQEFT